MQTYLGKYVTTDNYDENELEREREKTQVTEERRGEEREHPMKAL